jgi:hypothetical protein
MKATSDEFDDLSIQLADQQVLETRMFHPVLGFEKKSKVSQAVSVSEKLEERRQIDFRIDRDVEVAECDPTDVRKSFDAEAGPKFGNVENRIMGESLCDGSRRFSSTQ